MNSHVRSKSSHTIDENSASGAQQEKSSSADTPDPIAVIHRYEPRATQTLAPIVWQRAEGCYVFDREGRRYIDFTSGIMVANVGHAHPRVREAIRRQLDEPLLHAYLFPTEARSRLVEKLVTMSPDSLQKVLLLSTGAEAIEVCIKLTRLHGQSIDKQKKAIIAFENAYHGRTTGAQMLASDASHKDWIVNPDPDIHHLPFPAEHEGEEEFLRQMQALETRGLQLNGVAGFVIESYLGMRGPRFFPAPYVQALRRWASAHQALVAFDEIQSGFGRTGKLFCYQHYDVDADLVACGKGISSSLPLSAVLGRAELLDLPGPGHLSSTHTGNPLCCAAALAALTVLEEENLVAEAARKGAIVAQALAGMAKRNPDRIEKIMGRGLVHAIYFVDPSTRLPDTKLARRVTDHALAGGMMLFHTSNETIKLVPPLMIPDEALAQGLTILEQAIQQAIAEL